MPAFEGANRFTIQNSLQIENQYNVGNSSGFEMLQKFVVTSAMHDSEERYDPPRCHPKTREAVQSEIVNWVEKEDDDKKNLMWIHGPVGAGKSAIVQSIAEREDMKGVLCGFFAFSRNFIERNTAKSLVPTLAYQLAVYFQETKRHISNAVEKDPRIFSKSLESQMRSLIFEPLLAVEDGERIRPRFIIIDGLDECHDPKIQSYIIQSIVKNLSHSMLKVRFVIASRPELEIRGTFARAGISRHTTPLVLDEKFEPNEDIELFLREKFEEIKSTHPLSSILEQGLWPSETMIMSLLEKSSGQFIYPATAIKYIEDHRSNPKHRLEIIMNIRPHMTGNPFAEIDALYSFILESAQADYEGISQIFMILRWCYPVLINMIPELLNLEEQDLLMLLADFHSIIKMPAYPSLQDMSFFHASFSDFLTNETRSGKFYINSTDAQGHLAKLCISHFNGVASEKDKFYTKQAFLNYLLNSNMHWVHAIQDKFGSESILGHLRDLIEANIPHNRCVRSILHIGRKKFFFDIERICIYCVLGGRDRGEINDRLEVFKYDLDKIMYSDNIQQFVLVDGSDSDGGTICSTGYGVGQGCSIHMKNLMMTWLIQLLDEDMYDTKLVINDGGGFWDGSFVGGSLKVKSLDHSKVIIDVAGFLTEVKDINLPIQLYFHMFKVLLTEQAVPHPIIGQQLQDRRTSLSEVLVKFNLEEWRIEKLQSYIDEYLKKCDAYVDKHDERNPHVIEYMPLVRGWTTNVGNVSRTTIENTGQSMWDIYTEAHPYIYPFHIALQNGNLESKDISTTQDV